MDPEQKQWVRNQHAHEVRVSALKALKDRDFTTMMGSGINVLLTDMAGRSVAPEFQLNAEDLEKIKPAIIDSLTAALAFHRAMLRVAIQNIDNVIGPAGQAEPAQQEES